METLTANPSSAYGIATPCRALIRDVKIKLAAMIGAVPQEIFFTSGGTESNNWAVFQAAGRHIIAGAIEHKSVLQAAKNYGCDITLINPDSNGSINPEDIKRAIRPDTALISVMSANNETGVIQNISGIGEIAKSRKIPFHTDAVAAFGHIPVNVKNIDMLSVSAHKLYGPRGIGFLYVRQGTTIKPLITGGGQERGKRGGTENIPAIAGFGAAAVLAADYMDEEQKRYKHFDALFNKILLEKSPDIHQVAPRVKRLPGILSLWLPGLDSEIAVSKLDSRGVIVSGGAACNSDSHKPSAVLLSMGMDERGASEVIRVSPGRHTTEEEIYAAAMIISEVYEQNKKGCS
jgi:cysteine desulfurase